LYYCTTISVFFFFNDTPTTALYTLSLHDALPISRIGRAGVGRVGSRKLDPTYEVSATKCRHSHPRRQAREGVLAAQHGLQLGEFLVAPVVAAFFDIVGRDGELLCRFVVQALALGLARRLRLRRRVVDEPIER